MTVRTSQPVWTVEADATLQSVFDDPRCPELLHRALGETQSWQTRNGTTMRRILSASQLMPQCLATLLALGAEAALEGLGERPLEELLGENTKGQITALHVPVTGPSVRWGEARVARAPAEEPIVAAVAMVATGGDQVSDARVALTGAWPEPVRLAEAAGMLAGGPLSAERIEAVAAAVEAEVDPRGDFMGSAAYRRAMAGVLTRRALEACVAAPAAGGGG
jgi:CO/xanthine dehydrogenase FAD-binding subunit